MQGMTVTPPEKPYTKRTNGTRNTVRAEGEWTRDPAYPVILGDGYAIEYGVVVDTEGQAWGRWLRKGAK